MCSSVEQVMLKVTLFGSTRHKPKPSSHVWSVLLPREELQERNIHLLPVALGGIEKPLILKNTLSETCPGFYASLSCSTTAVREPQVVPWAFPSGSSHQLLNVVSK